MTWIRTLPADTFGKVTARFGGRIRYIALGRRVVLAWHVKARPEPKEESA
jgi:hypothetical protein